MDEVSNLFFILMTDAIRKTSIHFVRIIQNLKYLCLTNQITR